MSIFNRSTHAVVSDPTFKAPDAVSGTEVPLVVNCITQRATTEHYNAMQLYYHGGGVYTAVTFVLDDKSGIRVHHGPILENLIAYQDHITGSKKLNILTNVFDGSPMCTNLRIKTIATFATNDDTMFRGQLVDGGVTVVEYKGKFVQLIDARTTQDVVEFGWWYSPTKSYMEFRNEPNGDFLKTNLTTVAEESEGKIERTPKDMVEKFLNEHFPSLQYHFYRTVVEPCL